MPIPGVPKKAGPNECGAFSINPVLNKDLLFKHKNGTSFSYCLQQTAIHLMKLFWSYDFKRKL
jgi:hypothetical protein